MSDEPQGASGGASGHLVKALRACADALAPAPDVDDLAHDAKVQAVHLRLTQRANEVHSAHVALEEAAEEIVDLQDQLADALAPPEPTGWQPIATAPKDREVLLGALSDAASYRWLVDVGRYETSGGVGEPLKHSWRWRWLIPPTHWLDLAMIPAPPSPAKETP